MKKRKIAVVTGATGGFGTEFIKLMLNEEIDEIWAIARNKEMLGYLEAEFGEKIKSFPLDLTQRDSFDILNEKLKNENVLVKYLVNNAGYGKFCSFDELSVKDSMNMIDLNIGAVTAVGLICIPYMEKGSAILNIASQSAFFPLPYMNIYSASKAFVRNYTRALNVELKERDIRAVAVCPGWMKTGFFDRAEVGARKTVGNFFGMVTPDLVARKALADVKKGKDMSVYGFYVKLTHFLSKIAPQRLAMRIWLWQQRIKQNL